MRLLRLSVLLAFVPLIASAQLTDPTLRRARHALAEYDLSGRRTLDVIRDLGGYIRRQPGDAPYVREARFLRSVASADLLLLANFREDEALAARIAEAYGDTPQRLTRSLIVDLQRLEQGVYRQTARDARIAIEHLAGGDANFSGEGARHDVLFLAAAHRGVQSTNPVAALGAIGPDPCSESCEAPYAMFDQTGRRAIAAVEEVYRSFDRVRHRAAQGDPFSSVIVERIPQHEQAFTDVVLRPATVATDALQLTAASERATAAVQPDVIFSIQARDVRYGWTPRVRFENGRPRVFGNGEPLLPQVTTIELPTSFRPFPIPIRAVTAAFAGLPPTESIAVGGGPDAPSHILARVLVSAERADLHPNLLVGRDSEGRLSGVPIDMQRRESDARTNMWVRLGGHLIYGGGARRTEIPRIRTDDGGWRIDYEAVQARVPSDTSLAMRFMSSVPISNLSTTAFYVAPPGTSLVLLLP